ncbi:MAG: N-6 DNA methylase, partial [Candidatus Binatia bacterium]
MTKRTKLREKAARVPEVREGRWNSAVPAYLRDISTLNTESAKSHRFGALLQELFGEEPSFIEQYVSGIEKHLRLKEKDRVRRGSVDNLFDNLVIEFERDLRRSQAEAEGQLKKYVAALWSEEAQERRRPYLCIATDGRFFRVYSPSLAEKANGEIEPDHIHLHLLEKVDWADLEPHEVYFWVDRYYLRKEILAPTTEGFVRDFGPESHAFQVTAQNLLALWRSLGADSGFSVFYESWDKYLRIVYGSAVGEDDLFIRHTYLASLAKLMVWQRIGEPRGRPTNEDIVKVLEGQFFKDQGIENFLEEDFFSWLVRPGAEREGIQAARLLLSLLSNYNLRQLSEDILKSLYQELVDPKTRHDLGEFYTPDWLAHRMIREVLKDEPGRSLLDPACGSGTFLYQAIKEKRAKLGDSNRTLGQILEGVVGVDIHPLAVIIAKTSYIFALGDLLKRLRGRISIPVYLANTLKPPEPWADSPRADYRESIDGKEVFLPRKLVENPPQYDEAIETAHEFASDHVGKPMQRAAFESFLRSRNLEWAEDSGTVQTLYGLCSALKSLIEKNRDTIWSFVLKNIYKPLSLMKKFDLVVGNPPWLSYRYVDQLDYQSFLKTQITRTYALVKGAGYLITHMELATLFFLRAAHLYLKRDGAIAFVMPRSVFTADQHHVFREGGFQAVGLAVVRGWDLEEVEPLFNVPACVMIA